MIRHTSPNGEIGRRSGFKIRRVKPCEFESRPGDQMLIPSRFFCGSGFFYISRIWIRASFTGVPMSSAVCGLGEYAQESFFCWCALIAFREGLKNRKECRARIAGAWQRPTLEGGGSQERNAGRNELLYVYNMIPYSPFIWRLPLFDWRTVKIVDF